MPPIHRCDMLLHYSFPSYINGDSASMGLVSMIRPDSSQLVVNAPLPWNVSVQFALPTLGAPNPAVLRYAVPVTSHAGMTSSRLPNLQLTARPALLASKPVF